MITFVDDLHILRWSHGSVRVRRGAVAAHAGKRNAVEGPDGNRYVHPRKAEACDMRVLDDWVKTVYVPIRYFWILIRLLFGPASQIGLAPGRHFAQRWGNIVVIRRANLDRIGDGVTCPLGQRFRTERATNPEQRQKKAEQAQQTSE
ncbi:MAG: hypothetical protein DMF36_00365 [Verrucomicrobia bacterium]|nr:MAG: hypothetical protein DME64_02255 [Verrucomicrobiota bacterium]PYL41213.1 MAG: hypothetical protein DMF36_00365 [Verrucomicrobiota bacterium]